MPKHAIALTVGLLLCVIAGAASAQSESDDLDKVRSDKTAAEAEARALSERARKLAAEAAKLSNDLKSSAQQVRDSEVRLQSITAEQDRLNRSITELDASLAARKVSIARTLSALAGLAKVPPLAVVARPGDVAEMRLSASALAGLRPALAAQMVRLRDDRQQRRSQFRQLAVLQQEAIATLETLTRDRDRLNTLTLKKRKLVQGARTGAKKANARAQELAKKVENLTALMRRLDEIEPVAVVATPKPTQTFRSLRGRLPLPVAGTIRSRFGEVAGINNGSGIVLGTAARALVTAPHDAIVRFAGPFRSYGELLILDFGEGYHLLVAGLSVIDVVVGQWLLAGEPVGTTGKGGQPEIYLELRRAGDPIDPARWLAKR